MSSAASNAFVTAESETRLEDPLDAVDLAAHVVPDGPPALAVGVVRGIASGLVVRVGGAERQATRAKSCLVAPEDGDSVLCATTGERLFVLAVLESNATSTRIVADGDLTVQAHGRLGLGAGEKVEIAAGKEIGVFTGKLRVRAEAALAAVEELGLVGRSVESHVKTVVVVAERLETRADRLVQRAKQAFRFVETLEQVRAGVFDLRAEGLAAIRGESTIVAARTMAKLDGEQVKIG